MKKNKKLLIMTLSFTFLLTLVSCQGIKGDRGDKGEAGINGTNGLDGTNGKDGSSTISGKGVPSSSLGNNGDSYIDTETFDFYLKENGIWSKEGNIKGVAGDTGSQGEEGTSIRTGKGEPSETLGNNGDSYIDLSTFDFYVKKEGKWSKEGSIKGSKGETGNKGDKGEAGSSGSSGTQGDTGKTAWTNTILPSSGGYVTSNITDSGIDGTSEVTFTFVGLDDNALSSLTINGNIKEEGSTTTYYKQAKENNNQLKLKMIDGGYVVQATFINEIALNQFEKDTLNVEEPGNFYYKVGDYYFRNIGKTLVNCSLEDCLKDYFKGKNLSILGDSISTWKGISDNNDYADGLSLNANYYNANFSASYFANGYQDTYWGRLIKDYNMNLCVNNSWSGSYCTKHAPNQNSDSADTNGWYKSNTYTRASNLKNKNETTPDIIIFYIGMNDANAKVDASTFKEAYEATLDVIKEKYANSIVYCINQPDRTDCDVDNAVLNIAKAYNDGISELLKNEKYSNFHLVDQYNYAGLKGSKYKDNCKNDPSSNHNIHLDSNGHALLESCIIESMETSIIKVLKE